MAIMVRRTAMMVAAKAIEINMINKYLSEFL
jgi:hypothetical protein